MKLFQEIYTFAQLYNKLHDSIAEWNSTAPIAHQISKDVEKVIEILLEVPGMTQAHGRDFKSATPLFILRDGSVIKSYKNPLNVEHIFIADKSGKMVFGGYVGWIHSQGLENAVTQIRNRFARK